MRPDFIEVAPEDTLGEVAERMTALNVGAVVVKDFGKLIGILTERDLLKAMAARVHYERGARAPVDDRRSRSPPSPEMDVEEAAQRDARARVPPPAGAGRRRSGDQASSACGVSSARRNGPREPDPLCGFRPTQNPVAGAGAARVALAASARRTLYASLHARTRRTPRARVPCRPRGRARSPRVASIPSSRASASVPAARSDSTAVREMNVTP